MFKEIFICPHHGYFPKRTSDFEIANKSNKEVVKWDNYDALIAMPPNIFLLPEDYKQFTDYVVFKNSKYYFDEIELEVNNPIVLALLLTKRYGNRFKYNEVYFKRRDIMFSFFGYETPYIPDITEYILTLFNIYTLKYECYFAYDLLYNQNPKLLRIEVENEMF
jgi:hypothetical protein